MILPVEFDIIFVMIHLMFKFAGNMWRYKKHGRTCIRRVHWQVKVKVSRV